MKQTKRTVIASVVTCILLFAFGTDTFADSKVTLNDFYRPFELSEINPKNMQSWPYYRYTSMNWDEYGLFGTVHVMRAKHPAKLSVSEVPFDIEQEIREGWTFV